jgi:hypothetical protein
MFHSISSNSPSSSSRKILQSEEEGRWVADYLPKNINLRGFAFDFFGGGDAEGDASVRSLLLRGQG